VVHHRTLVLLAATAILGAFVLAGCGRGPVKPSEFAPISGDQAAKSGKAAGTPREAYMKSKAGGGMQAKQGGMPQAVK
jgi:hypothetical protein